MNQIERAPMANASALDIILIRKPTGNLPMEKYLTFTDGLMLSFSSSNRFKKEVQVGTDSSSGCIVHQEAIVIGT